MLDDILAAAVDAAVLLVSVTLAVMLGIVSLRGIRHFFSLSDSNHSVQKRFLRDSGGLLNRSNR